MGRKEESLQEDPSQQGPSRTSQIECVARESDEQVASSTDACPNRNTVKQSGLQILSRASGGQAARKRANDRGGGELDGCLNPTWLDERHRHTRIQFDRKQKKSPRSSQKTTLGGSWSTDNRAAETRFPSRHAPSLLGGGKKNERGREMARPISPRPLK